MVMEIGITAYFLYLDDAINQHCADDFRERNLRIARLASVESCLLAGAGCGVRGFDPDRERCIETVPG